jgi:hypothetical protein
MGEGRAGREGEQEEPQCKDDGTGLPKDSAAGTGLRSGAALAPVARREWCHHLTLSMEL